MKSRNKTLCLWSVYFQQRYKNNSVGEKRALKKKRKQTVLGQLNMHVPQTSLGLYLTLYTKMNSNTSLTLT